MRLWFSAEYDIFDFSSVSRFYGPGAFTAWLSTASALVLQDLFVILRTYWGNPLASQLLTLGIFENGPINMISDLPGTPEVDIGMAFAALVYPLVAAIDAYQMMAKHPTSFTLRKTHKLMSRLMSCESPFGCSKENRSLRKPPRQKCKAWLLYHLLASCNNSHLLLC